VELRFEKFLRDKKEEIIKLGQKGVIPYLLEDWNKVEEELYQGSTYQKTGLQQFGIRESLYTLVNALRALSRLNKISKKPINSISVLHRRDRSEHDLSEGTLLVSTNISGAQEDILYIGSILAIVSGFSRLRKDRAARWSLFDYLVRKLIIQKFDSESLTAVYTCTYYDWFNLSLFTWANFKCINTIERQHGLLYPHPFYSDLSVGSDFFPKRLEIWGESWLIDKGFSSSISYVVRNDQKIVAAPLTFTEYEFLVIGGCRLDILYWITKNLPASKVLYRPHPAEDLSVCERLLPQNVKISNVKNTTLSDDILKCERVLGVASTVLIESCLYNRAVSLIPLQGSEYMVKYGLKFFPASSVLPREKFFINPDSSGS
jgi:hypothetical protein